MSGGCVEGAVVTEALAVLDGRREPGVVTFGYSDDEAFAVGLTCGGTIHLFVEPRTRLVSATRSTSAARDRCEAEEPVACRVVTTSRSLRRQAARATRGRASLGQLGDPATTSSIVWPATPSVELDAGLTSTRHYGRARRGREREVEVFIESFPPPPR